MKTLGAQIRAELKLFLRDKTVVFFSILLPLVTVAFFGYLNRDGQVGEVSYATFLIAGGIGMVVSSAAFENLGTALARQRDAGIMKRLGGTPLRVWVLVGAKILSAAAITLAQTAVMVTLNVLLFKARISGILPWGLVVLLLGILVFAAMGIALAGLCRNADAASAAGLALSLPMQFLCGTIFPVDQMPPLLRRIAQALPLTYFVQALRGAVVAGDGPAVYAREWLVLLGCLLVAFFAAVRTFRWE